MLKSIFLMLPNLLDVQPQPTLHLTVPKDNEGQVRIQVGSELLQLTYVVNINTFYCDYSLMMRL